MQLTRLVVGAIAAFALLPVNAFAGGASSVSPAVPPAVSSSINSAAPTLPAPEPSTPPPTPIPAQTTDYPGAIWTPAADGNFGPANRPADDSIDMVIIHDIEGSVQSAIHIFQDPKAHVSAHYIVSSSTGQVFQLVKEHDVAWHAGNLPVNRHSVGIEHEGFAYRPGYYNPLEYETSAKLVRSITQRYHIPRDRQHIIGHAEVPNPFKAGLFGGAGGHTDPGPFWDWDTFMTLVRNDAHLESSQSPPVIHPGERLDVSVIYTNTGDDPWKAGVNSSAGAASAPEGAVYLGTDDPPGRVSSLFNMASWTSPRMAATALNGDTAPGAQAHFTFKLEGPRSLGSLTESFRPTRYPPAPHVPVAFGDVFNMGIAVEPWDITALAGGPGFDAPGWERNGSLFWQKPPASGVTPLPAAWSIPLPISGNWDVYARWPAGKNHASRASYVVTALDGVHPVVVDQRKGGEWRKLGRFPFAAGASNQVSLNGAGKGITVADAMRFIGPFP